MDSELDNAQRLLDKCERAIDEHIFSPHPVTENWILALGELRRTHDLLRKRRDEARTTDHGGRDGY